MADILESARLGRQDDEATPKLFFLIKLDKISQFLRWSRKTPISNLDPYNWGYPIRIKGIPCHDVASVMSCLKGYFFLVFPSALSWAHAEVIASMIDTQCLAEVVNNRRPRFTDG